MKVIGGIMDGQMRREILVRLSKATRRLSSCSSSVDIKDALRDLRACYRTSGCNDSEVSGSTLDDGHYCDVKLLVSILKTDCNVVAYAASNTLFVFSNCLQKISLVTWASFLRQSWTFALQFASRSGSFCCQSSGAKLSNTKPSHSGSKRKVAEKEDESTIAWDELGVHSREENLLSAASSMLQLFQKILKRCLKSSDGGLDALRTFFDLFTEYIKDVVTASCTEDLLKCSEHAGLITHSASSKLSSSEHELRSKILPRELLLASLLRLVCTATQITTLDSSFSNPSGSLGVRSLLATMEKLIRVLSSSMPARSKICPSANSLSVYLCHKLLMINMRLSECFEVMPSLALSCLKSLQSCGHDLLDFNLQASSASEADSLDDSPFLATLDRCPPGEASSKAKSIGHLQRHALYVLFKIVSFIHSLPEPINMDAGQLIEVGRGPDKDGEGSFTLRKDLRQSALPILTHWLDKQSQPVEFNSCCTSDSGSMRECSFLGHLAESLVQFFFQEDDLMLKMLLQLLNQPFLLENLSTEVQPVDSVGWQASAKAFSPERMFHAFLAAIQYNSSVLLDFLISEDSGSLCLLYLMRSIRCIIQSWPIFLISAPCINADSLDVEPGKCLLAALAGATPVECCSCAFSGVETCIKTAVVKQVATCLLDLKISIERLHRGSLFPYNPSALLKRFASLIEHLQEFSTGPDL